MLRGLDIRDVLIIERLELGFRPGLNVLTGETGAGKSILLDALGFVLGWRGRAELVRQGAERGEVTAVFDLGPDHPARAVLAEAGLPESDELILRRVNGRDGRKTAWINDRRASGEVLRQLSDTLVELHGQHDDRGLLNPRGHRMLLDAYGGLEPQVAVCRAAWADWTRARAETARTRARLDEVRAEEEFLRFAVNELDELNPQPGEDETLDTARRRMQGAERIRDDVARALQALGGGDGGEHGAERLLGDAARWLEAVEDRAGDMLAAPLEAIGRALVELGEAQQGVEDCLQRLEFDPRELEQTEERLFAIRALARKHSVQPDGLAELASELRDRLDALDRGAADLDALEKAEKVAAAEYRQRAETLSAARKSAGAALDAAMAKELAPLKLERAVFATEVGPAEPGPDGGDAVNFTVATNPGAPAGPLDKIASGGELSRFLLALKVCLTEGDRGLTIIFDEIDRGVGGATADAVGRRLAELSSGAQILVVTHSPQVAALGAHHWRVEKCVSGGVTTSVVTPLSETERVDEIARMLAGEHVTDAARDAARALLVSGARNGAGAVAAARESTVSAE